MNTLSQCQWLCFKILIEILTQNYPCEIIWVHVMCYHNMVKCNTPPRALVVAQIFMFHMLTTPLEENQSSYMEGNLTLLPFGKNNFFKWHQKQRYQLKAYDLQSKRKTRCMNTLMYKNTKTILNAMCLQALHCGRTLKLFKV